VSNFKLSDSFMPKQLILLRHAEALEKQTGQLDKDRELTSRGIMQATQAGAYLKENRIKIDAIFSSSAIRTNMTAAIVADAIQCDTKKVFYLDELYDATTRTFLEFINTIDDEYRSVLCVGHNPVITYLAEYLTKADVGDMSPGDFVIMNIDINQWREVKEGSATFNKHFCPSIIKE
jgi:phosphohistidine phosphatase